MLLGALTNIGGVWMGGRLSSLALAVISVSVYHLAQRAMPDSVRPAPLFTLVYGVGFVALALAAATGGPLGGLGEISSVATHWAPWLLAASVIGIELGVYTMYRNGWELSDREYHHPSDRRCRAGRTRP
ncbi:MAG: hypothetical protein V9F03_14310 [Microthrixaceae bacterium]